MSTIMVNKYEYFPKYATVSEDVLAASRDIGVAAQ